MSAFKRPNSRALDSMDGNTQPIDLDRSSSERQDSPPPTTSAQSKGAAHLKQKRARSQLSCTPCRQGKLKCNRQHDPACDQCLKRGRQSACVFLPPPVKNKPAQNVKGRIRQLESLVVDLMNQNRSAQGNETGSKAGTKQSHTNGNVQNSAPVSQPTPPSDNDTSPASGYGSQRNGDGLFDDVDAAATPFGQMKISKDEISYVGESHWGAILNSISDLKRELNDDEEEDETTPEGDSPESTFNNWSGASVEGEQSPATSGLGFMLGSAESCSKDQLIVGVPEKRVADRLLSLWFNSPDPFKPLIHAPTFQDEYRRFWRNPRETPAMWLGLLFSIMSLAASFGLRDIDPSSQQAQKVLQEVTRYHKLAASAALLGDFTKPKQYTIECLILYAAGLRSDNAFVNVWLMIGLLIRLALRMGYHRDPNHYPAISVFHGEMRRRVWAIISMIDVLISFQLGLPSMVKTIHSDTQPPRNLLDRDFNINTKVLPPSRGIDELTPSSYTRAKLRITRIFADASELSHATIEPSREEVMRLDRQLEEAKAAIPPLLQMTHITNLVTDPAEQLMCRFNLDLLYLKTKTVLHRRYMLTPLADLSPIEQEQGIGYSRLACVDSAKRVLEHHHTIYTASQTGGQLESVKWYMGSISTHDFLLAAMIVCLELSTQMHVTGLFKCPQRPGLMDALEKSQKIWAATSSRKRSKSGTQQLWTEKKADGEADVRLKGEQKFDETEKAARAMAVMLEKVRAKLAEFPGREIEACEPFRGAPAQGVGAGGPVGISMSGLMAHSGVPLNGVAQGSFDDMGTKQWDSSPGNGLYGNAGTPEGLRNGGRYGFSNAGSSNSGSASRSQQATSLSNSTSPQQQQQQQPQSQATHFPDFRQTNLIASTNNNDPDFSMIDSMLDADPSLALDWEMWDNSVFDNPQAIASQRPAWDGMDDLAGMVDMRAGNAVIGGSGPSTVVGGSVGFGGVGYREIGGGAAVNGGLGPTAQMGYGLMGLGNAPWGLDGHGNGTGQGEDMDGQYGNGTGSLWDAGEEFASGQGVRS